MISKLKIFLSPKHQIYFVFIIIAMIISAFLEMIGIGSIPIYINLLLDSEKLNNYLPNTKITDFLLSGDLFRKVTIGAMLIVFIFVCKNFFLFFLNFFSGLLFKNIRVYNSKKLYNIYISSPLTFHINRNPAILTRNLTGEVLRATYYIEAFATVIRESLIVLTIVILLLIFDPITSTTVLVAIGGFSALFYVSIKKSVNNLAKKRQSSSASQIQNVNQVFGAIKETKLLNLNNYFMSKYISHTIKVETSNFYINLIVKTPRIFIELIAIVGILLVGSLYIWQGYSLEEMIPLIGLLVVSSIRLIPCMNAITSTLTHLKDLSISFNYVQSEYKNFENKIEKKFDIQSKRNGFFNKNISLVNIDFNYPDMPKKVLKNLSLEIKKGEMVGIIGKSGVGKTTLIDIILGLLKVSNGKILIDGQNLYSNMGKWQSLIGYIPQDIYLMDDTILQNVAFGIEDKYVEKDKIDSALRSAQIYEFVKSLPNGYNSIVGNRGVKLSGGQKQRIGISRALYRNPEILILDEATNSLDVKTEANFMDNIYGLRGQRTLIIATHRIFTLKECDKIFLLDNGEIEQVGSFSEILNSNKFLKKHFDNKIYSSNKS